VFLTLPAVAPLQGDTHKGGAASPSHHHAQQQQQQQQQQQAYLKAAAGPAGGGILETSGTWQLAAGRHPGTPGSSSGASIQPLAGSVLAAGGVAAAAWSRELEERLAAAEAQAAASQQAAVAATRAAELAVARLAPLGQDLARAAAELGDLRGRYDAAVHLNGQLQQQVGGLAADLRALESRWVDAAGQLAQGGASAAEQRQVLGSLAVQLGRLEAERGQDRALLAALQAGLAGAGEGLGEERRGRAAGEAALREAARQQQAALLSDLAALAAEVAGYR
jgi:cell division septum initiation protein DivIVA